MIPDAGEVADRAEALLQASTPGPWRAIEGGEESDRTTDHNLYIQAAIDDEMIRWSHIADVPWRVDKTESNDAALIAATPELLAALIPIARAYALMCR